MSAPIEERPQVGVGAGGSPDKGLKADVVSFWDGVAIGVDSTAPAYSIAAALGSIVVIVGTKAPAVLLVSFLPMFFISGAFYFMNRADQDCGTVFSWVTRAIGPWTGWMGGWAIFVSGVLVIGAQADVAARYAFQLVGLDTLADNRIAVVGLAVLLVALMTWISVIGTELSARVQRAMVFAQVGAVLLFVVVAAWKIVAGKVAADAPTPSLSWLNPVGIEPGALVAGMLLGVFCYWGWETSVNLTEESTDSAEAPGKAAIVSTVLLMVMYLGSAIAIIGVLGLSAVAAYDDDEALFGEVGAVVLGPWGWVLLLSIIVSGLASTQTTILPASRTSLSMAVHGAFPKRFGEIDSRYDTPAFGTWVIGAIAIAWYVGGSLISENFLFDSLSALSIVVAFYYALTGFATVAYWRRELFRSVRAFFLIGVGPLVGGTILTVMLVAAVRDYADPENSYSGTPVLGVGAPLVMAILMFVAGALLMVAARFGGARAFFRRRPAEQVSDEVARAALGG